MALDDADKKAIAEMIAESLKTSTEDQGKTLDARIATAIKGAGLGDQVASAVAEAVKALSDGDGGDGKGKGDGKGADGESEAVRRLEAKLAEQGKKLETEAKARADAEATSKRSRLHNAVRDALMAQGVPKERVRGAIALLSSDGRLAFNDKDAPGMTFEREWGIETVAAEKAAKEWLGTDEGKLYIPPVGTGGTGGKLGKQGSGGRPNERSASSVVMGALRGTG